MRELEIVALKMARSKKHTPFRGCRHTTHIILLAAYCIALLVGGATIGRFVVQSSFSQTVSEHSDTYRGVIQLAPDRQGRCEQIELDNKSATLMPKGSGQCEYVLPAPATRGTMGRINGIGDYFKQH